MRTFLLISSLFTWGELQADQADDIQLLRDKGVLVSLKNGSVHEIRVNNSEPGDDGFAAIGRMTTLKQLSISSASMQDRHLASLGNLNQLEVLMLNGTQLTDDGYRHFGALKKLRQLSLFHPSRDNPKFTGAGLAHLRALANLERLTFAGATAGDDAFEAVGELTQLRQFSSWHNWESPTAIQHLRKLTSLESLKLGQRLPSRGRPLAPSLDDQTLTVIAQMPSLQRLELQEARLTATGLLRLRSLPDLRELNVKWVETSDEDIQALREAMPETQINWTPITDEDRESLLKRKLKLP